MSKFNPRLLQWQVLPGRNVTHKLFLSFSRGRPLENPCTALCQGREQEGRSSWDRDAQVSVQLISGAVSCSMAAQPAPSKGHSQGDMSVEGLAARTIPKWTSKAAGRGNASLGPSRRICSALLGPSSGKERGLLDAIDFRGLRGRQVLVHDMRVDEHLRHFLVLLCFVLTEIKESLQQVQIEVVHCHNGDPSHKTDQAWKQTCSVIGFLSPQQCPHPTALLGLSPARGQCLCLWEVAFYCMSCSKHP